MKTYIFRVNGKEGIPKGLTHFPLMQNINRCQIPELPELSGNIYILRNHELSDEILNQIKTDAEKKGYTMEVFELKFLY